MLVAVIMTYNEESHIDRCIRSLGFVDKVILFDSFSTDRTRELARNLGAQIIDVPWKNSYSLKFNEGLAALRRSLSFTWCLRIDADEYAVLRVTRDDLFQHLENIAQDVDLIALPRQMLHQEQPVFSKAVMTPRLARGEFWVAKRFMDEHFESCGRSMEFTGLVLFDHRLDHGSLLKKHLVYARKEALDYFVVYSGLKRTEKLPTPFYKRRKAYYSLPIFVRALSLSVFNLTKIKLSLRVLRFWFVQSLLYRLAVDWNIFCGQQKFNSNPLLYFSIQLGLEKKAVKKIVNEVYSREIL